MLIVSCLIFQPTNSFSDQVVIPSYENARDKYFYKILYKDGGETLYYEDVKIDTSKGERWFCSVEEALEAGWRAPN